MSSPCWIRIKQHRTFPIVLVWLLLYKLLDYGFLLCSVIQCFGSWHGYVFIYEITSYLVCFCHVWSLLILFAFILTYTESTSVVLKLIDGWLSQIVDLVSNSYNLFLSGKITPFTLFFFNEKDSGKPESSTDSGKTQKRRSWRDLISCQQGSLWLQGWGS